MVTVRDFLEAAGIGLDDQVLVTDFTVDATFEPTDVTATMQLHTRKPGKTIWGPVQRLTVDGLENVNAVRPVAYQSMQDA